MVYQRSIEQSTGHGEAVSFSGDGVLNKPMAGEKTGSRPGGSVLSKAVVVEKAAGGSGGGVLSKTWPEGTLRDFPAVLL